MQFQEAAVSLVPQAAPRVQQTPFFVVVKTFKSFAGILNRKRLANVLGDKPGLAVWS
jgi:hypothetical protein